MHVLFVSHYFHPEVGAPQTRIVETAQRLSARGHEVTVLTGFPNYPDGVIPERYRGHLMLREQIGPVRVVRSLIYPAPNRGFGRRLLNHTAFAVSSVLASPTVGRPDVVIAETPPLSTAVAGALIARGRHAPLVLNVADLWPEPLVHLGILRDPRAIRLAEALERFAYRHSAVITVPTTGIRTTLLSRGEPQDKVVHLPNAVDVDGFVETILLDLAGDERERARVRRVYQSYAASASRQRAWSGANPGNRRIIGALYEAVSASLSATNNFPTDDHVLLDIGCGYGDLVGWLRGRGASVDCLYGVDVLENRVAEARRRVDGVAFEVADARSLPFAPESVNAVVLSTVLSSILDADDRQRVAAEAVRVLRPGGVIVSYDLRYSNPRNRSVRRIGRGELAQLFPGTRIETRTLTLLPPLARRLGSATEVLYGPLAAIPPLRTHLFAVVRPQY